MSRRRMFFRIVWKAMWLERGRVASSLAALVVGATLASAFLNLYLDLPRKMTAEFRSLGANLVVAPSGGAQTLPQDVLDWLFSHRPEVARLGWLYAVGTVQGNSVTFGGTELEGLALLNPTWKVLAAAGKERSGQSLAAFLESSASLKDREAVPWLLAGEKAAAHFGWDVGQSVELEYGGKQLSLPLRGILSTGGSADSQFLLPVSALQKLTGRENTLSLIELLVPGSAAQVEAVRQELAAGLPELEVRPVRQVVESEARVVLKVRGLMFGLTAVVLGIVILSVITTVSGLVLDRQREIGILKALGGRDGTISAIFVAETACFALFAGLVGYGIGFGLAQWGSQRIFHSFLHWRWEVLPAVLAVTLLVALAATAFPVRLIRRLQPAEVLRGN
ncbi:MAG: FtsX-like permease family protein [Acidobacteria bacterium]|nr:FtsX-like permease family protein [Acidobacteriota bacterium]